MLTTSIELGGIERAANAIAVKCQTMSRLTMIRKNAAARPLPSEEFDGSR
jgi:hypothetical protein